MCSNSHTGDGRGGWANGSDRRQIKNPAIPIRFRFDFAPEDLPFQIPGKP